MILKNLLKNKQILIAEIGQSHDGSLNYVHSFINESYKAGVDVVKFQTHLAEEESTYDDKFRTFTTYKKENRFNYWKRMQFTDHEWVKIIKHVKSKKMLFSSSVFSFKAIEKLEKLGIDVWKIPSGESLNLNLIKEVTRISNKPIFISTGMNSQLEIDEIYNFMKNKKNLFLLMHCVSQYPCKLKNLGLNLIDEFKKRYKCHIGYSDHSGILKVPIIALERGVRALEVHVTFDKKIFTPDSSSSLEFKDIKFLSEFIKIKKEIDQNKLSRDTIFKRIKKNRNLFSKSLSFKTDMKKNQIIKKKDLTLKKPGTGLKYEEMNKILGKRLKINLSKNYLIKLDYVKKK